MSSSKLDKSAKKLKQVCLPFKLANSPSEDTNSKCRKRKLSGSENEETRVENSNVELLNGGTKCFIKSDDENKIKSHSEEISEDVNNKMDTTEFVSEQNIEKTDKEKFNEDALKNCENNKDVADINSLSSNSDVSQNILVNSISENVIIENNSSILKTPTPKRKLKKQESAKKQEERLRLKQEKEKEKERAREEKQRLIEQKRIAEIEAKRLRELEKEKERKQKEEEKKAKELEKERERKQKEEEKKSKELEKERERKQKEEDRKAKELEKEKDRKQKEEEKKAKELEKEKQKEEKLLKEEMEKKKKEKTKAAFIGFFKQKSFDSDISKKDCEIIDQEPYFMPFQTKQDMKMAPSCRKYLNNDKKKNLDICITQYEKNEDVLYLSLLKSGKYEPSKSERTWPVCIEDDDDVIIIETDSKNVEDDLKNIEVNQKNKPCKIHWKLLQFNENKRPPYWGTWMKKSLYVKPRRPFACDKIMFDYEVDSDDEWEEEDPGESIHGTDNEEEPEDDYEVDNDVFVPHGYLSDEEGEQDNDNASKEAQKEKLKLLGEEFEAEIKKKTERIKPKLVGCIWIPNNVINPENVSKPVADTLLKYRCIWDDEEPILTEAPIINSPNDLTASENNKILLLSDSIMPDLIKFIHANNTSSIKTAAKNFINELEKNGQNIDSNTISLSSVKKTIKHIATKSTHVAPWYVSKENFEKYDLEYPKDVEMEVPKTSKSTVKKITSFMTPQCQKTNANLFEKSCSEMEQKVADPKKNNFIPKNLFNVKENPKLQTKEEQKINIVGGKKRITPILLSPKKKFKLLRDIPKEKILSSEMKIACEETSIIANETL